MDQLGDKNQPGGKRAVFSMEPQPMSFTATEAQVSADRSLRNLHFSAAEMTNLPRVQFNELVRTRRTHKAFHAQPLDRATLDELFELARWAPNHHLTNPWRFRVLGEQSLAALKAAAGAESAAKLDRAPTLVAASVVQSGDEVEDDENFAAGACAVFIVLLAAHAHGLAGYWRTPAVLRTAAGRAACCIPEAERVLGLIHLGRARSPLKKPPERAPLQAFRVYLE